MSLSCASSSLSRGARGVQTRLSAVRRRGECFSSFSSLERAARLARQTQRFSSSPSLCLSSASHEHLCAALCSPSAFRASLGSTVAAPFSPLALAARALSTASAGPSNAAPESGGVSEGDSSRGGASVERMEDEEGSGERRKRSPAESADREQPENEEGEMETALEDKYRQCVEEVESLKKKNRELQDKALRAFADMENARMRHQKEMASLKDYAVSDFAKAMLEVADAMAYATNSLKEAVQTDALIGPEENGDLDVATLKARLQQIYDGVKLTENLLHKTLDRFGVEQYNPEGEKFNPALHEALFELEHPEKAKGEVAQVIQRGYKIKERVLRAAKVGVSKGAPNSA
ncbi:co-chaperone GrpE protein [Toxoplasma gondii TgCatPRC2]|uniref:Co-chaperone GrpE protein n=5 Tax=Toxoplasma gondii TaxID=5811 RepID=A0A151H5W4_TOXGO|nr:co-chaperone GrpE protein [Toxoplasma gondii ME49]EPT27740.1 co-chaperone GrpE protein [Toxoplasma gondii ME49]KFH01429.1 co-chaperone GrpE protein [Toxoplasma gondii VAND]KYF45403.1 co-chaperone GrpE protein [Toxoplasma gondii ARI]KYK64739.1 co-chaperone GrpE protein [Toxoplasma gondii TgCatPRC2]|eukprot:XP_002368651.1 co-chaperone GrpE protein [Toxoplasma gondii ME49]